MTSLFGRRRSARDFLGASLAVIAAAASFAASPAAAQDTAAANSATNAASTSSPSVVSDIIVTAQFRSQKLQDTPVAITALTGQTLAARGEVKLTDLQAPNLVLQQASGSYGPAAQIFIRGVGQSQSSFAFEPGVGVYIDDVYYGTLFGNIFSLLDLDRVEVLRGPQGTLAGMDSIGGAIKLYSKKPDGSDSGFVEADTGSYDLARFRGAANITIVPDKVFARISGMAQHIVGYIDRVDYKCTHPSSPLPSYVTSGGSCLLGHEGGGNEAGGRVQLRVLPTDKLEINLSADYYNMRGDPGPSVLVQALPSPQPTINGVSFGPAFQAPNPYTSYATFSGAANSTFQSVVDTDLTSWGTAGTIDYELSPDIKFTSITAYRSVNAIYAEDYSESPFPLSEQNSDDRDRQFTQEVRLNANIRHLVDLTLGGFYYDDSEVEGGRNLIYLIDTDFLTDDQIKSNNKSAFAHAVVHVTDRLNITGGVRYTDDSKNYLFVRSTADGSYSPFESPINGLSATYAGKVWDYRAVIDYRWSPNIFTYAQFSTGFKGGGVNPTPFFQNQVAPFNEEKLKAYEIGIKSDFFDHRVRLNLVGFFNNYSNIQIQTTAPFFNVNLPVQGDPNLPDWNPVGGTAPSAAWLNAGDVHQKGFETELTLRPTEALLINASLSYLDGHYTSLLPQALASGVTLNMELPFAPHWQSNVGIQYDLPFASGTLTPRLEYEYQSTSFATAVNLPPDELGLHNVLNARLSYRTGDWELTASVTNLTNDFYYQTKFDILESGGFLTGVPSRPREWGLSVRRSF